MRKILLLITLTGLCSSCKRDHNNDDNQNNNTTTQNPLTTSTDVKGYGITDKLCGIWSGPLNSTTSLGSFSQWTVDLRPVSAAQVSSKSELDSVNDIFLSVFLSYFNNEYRMSFRNGGGFAGMQRISYMWCDSVSETGSSSFYRFSDFMAGMNRAYANFLFRSDSLYFTVYTSRYNTVSPPQLHINWQAKLQDTTETQDAITHFGFPQKVLVKDLSTAFTGLTESIFYNISSDPYPENQQPYLGHSTVNITYSGFTPASGTQSFVTFTTQPLFSGVSYQSQNMKYMTRYVMLSVDDLSYTFTYVHPDDYYVYVLQDADGNGVLSTGDHINSPLSPVTFTMSPLGSSTVNVNVNFTVP